VPSWKPTENEVSAPAVWTTEDHEAPARADPPSLRILFITSRFPAPPLKGDQLRAYHQLRRLGRRHRVTLVCLAHERDVDPGALADSCERIVCVPFGTLAMARGLLAGLASGRPFQASLYRSGTMRRALRQILRTGFDLVHVQLARMAPYLHEVPCPRPQVVDLVDALSLSMARRAAEEGGLRGLLARVEAKRLARYERALCAEVDQAMVVSPRDRQAIGDFPNLRLVPNAVDLEAFPFTREGRARERVVFTGNMGYFPNVDAARWLAAEVWPRVRAVRPEARLSIVGARPARAVRALGERPGIEVTGYVDDVGRYLREATVAVAPMRTGAGQQFKVLEAMASGAPLAATPAEAEQVGARSGQDLLVAEDAAGFADAVLALLRDPSLAERLARSARRLVERHYTWDHSVALLEEAYRAALLREAGRTVRAAAAP
jgi:sugar transferase (PEP-CTERM/EpsH1 system associated)